MKTIQNDTHIMWVDETEDKTVVIAAYPPIDGCCEFETLPPDAMTYGEYMRSNPEIPNTKNDIETYSKMMKAHDDNFIKSNDIQDLKESYYYKGRRDEAIKAKSETRFSEEDIIKTIELVQSPKILSAIKIGGNSEAQKDALLKVILNRLAKPKWEFVPQMETVKDFARGSFGGAGSIDIEQPKVVNNKVFGSWIKK